MTQLRPTSFVLAALVLSAALPAAAQDVLLIPESSNDSVLRFDPDTGAFLGQAVPPAPDQLSTPIDASINANGIIVSDQLEDACLQFSFGGVFVAQLVTGVDNTRGMADRMDRLFMTGGNGDYVPMFDLNSGLGLGDFIPAGVGGLDSPFDILFRDNDCLVASINSDQILQYDLAGTPLGVFAGNVLFGEQIYIAANGNVLCADFSANAILEFLPDGTPVGSYSVSGPRGCYELPNGNVLTTNSSGVHEVARPGGGIVDTKLDGVSARFIQRVNLTATAVEAATWGRIKNQFK